MAAEPPAPRRSRCRVALWLALLFGALGAVGLLAGACLDTAVSDLLVYLGGVGVFFSLPWWVFWVVGNLEVPPDELRDDVGLGARRGAGADGGSLESWRARRLARLARVFSARFSLPSSSSATSASVPSHADRPHARFASVSASSSSSSSSSTSGPERAGAAGGRTASLSPSTATPQDLAGNRWCIPETVESQSKYYCQSSDGCQETA